MDLVYLLVGLLILLIVGCAVNDAVALRRRQAAPRRADSAFDGE